jgi:hypothetical protein
MRGTFLWPLGGKQIRSGFLPFQEEEERTILVFPLHLFWENMISKARAQMLNANKPTARN